MQTATMTSSRAIVGKPPAKPRGKPFVKGGPGGPGRKPDTPDAVLQRRLERDARLAAKDKGLDSVAMLGCVVDGAVPRRNKLGEPDLDEKGRQLYDVPNVGNRILAAIAILDRGYGRPPQALEVFGGDVTPEQREGSALEFIESRLALIRQRRRGEGDAGEPGGGGPPAA